jgi:hypothetical protein
VEAGTVPLAAPFGFFDVQPDVLSESFFKVYLRPWRIIAFVSLAIFAYTLATYLWRPIERTLGWLLLPLGQAALYSYIVHFFIILAFYNLAPSLLIQEEPGVPNLLDTLLQLLLVAVLWFLVKRKVLFNIVPN